MRAFWRLSSRRRLDRGRLEPREWERLLEACERLGPARLYVDQSASTIPGIRAKAERLLARPEGLRLLVVDYLQLVQPDRQGQSRTEEVSQIARGLKLVAQDLDIPVLALAQLNRQVEQRTDKRPLLADLRESGEIEAAAGQVLMLYRDDYYERDSERPGEVELNVAKNRHGRTGDTRLVFRARIPTFASYWARSDRA